VIAGVVVVSLAWYLRSYFRSRHSLRDLRSDFAALKDFGAAAWLGILGILFIWVLLLNLTRPFEGIESWIFAAAALVALAFYIVSRLRER
jgi:hypothetical protein